MRVKVRRILDVDKPVNLRKLAPNEKIKAGFLVQWHQTKTLLTNSVHLCY